MAYSDTHFRIGAVSQAVAISGTSAQSATLSADCVVVRIVSTTDCFVSVGASPTAVADTTMFLPAYTVDYIKVSPGQKIAGIYLAASGTLYITEMSS